MSGMDITNLLPSTQTSNSKKNNSIFNVLPGLNASASTDALGINYSEIKSMKHSSYKKLLQKYYKEDRTTDEASIEVYKKKQTLTADKAASLASNLDDLAGSVYTEENRDKITEKFNDFVDKYNKLVDNSSESDSKAIKQKTEWLVNMVKEYSDSLNSIGIGFNIDGKLEIDKDKFAKTDMKSLQNMFGNGVNNLGSKIAYKAEQIYSLAKTYGSSATAYTNNGKYSRNYSANSNFETTT